MTRDKTVGVRTRLSVMMALAYAVQGAWWPILSVHLKDLGISGRGRGWIFASLALSALVTPWIAGRVADRLIPAQKLLALIYAVGSVMLAVAATGVVTSFAGLFGLFLLYWMVTIPFLGLINTIAMRNLERPRNEFGAIRLWGTVGWMAVGWLVSTVMVVRSGGTYTLGTYEAFAIGSGLSVILAVFCFYLPDTPPLATGQKGLPLSEAIEMLRRPGVLAVLIVGFGVSLTTPFVYQAVPAYLRDIGMSRGEIARDMTLGQVPEIVGLGILPLVLRRLGRRRTMMLGIASWVLYHGSFAMRPTPNLSLLVIPLNGLAIAFFHVTAPMYLDSHAPSQHRAGVQSLWVVMTSGFGSLAGGLLAGEVMQHAGSDWRTVFAIPAAIALTLLIAFGITFRSKESSESHATPNRASTPSRLTLKGVET